MPLTVTPITGTFDTVDRTIYTYAVNLGSAAQYSHFVVGVTFRSGSDRTLSSLTLDGQTGTRVCRSGVLSTNNLDVYLFAYTAGGTKNIVATYSGGGVRSGLVVYGVTSDTGIVDVYSTNWRDDIASVSAPISCPAGGAIIGVLYSENPATTRTWTGITEDYEIPIEATDMISSAHLEFASAQDTLVCGTSGTTNDNDMLRLVALSDKLEPLKLTDAFSTSSTGAAFDVEIGAAHADRLVICVVHADEDAGVARTFSGSPTINFSNATVHAQIGRADGERPFVGIFSLLVPSGVTAGVIYTLTPAVDSHAIEVYTLNDYESATPSAATGNAASGAATATVNAPQGGYLVAGATSSTLGETHAYSGNGAVKDIEHIDDWDASNEISWSSARKSETTADATYDVTVTPAGGAVPVVVAAAVWTKKAKAPPKLHHYKMRRAA